MDFKHTLTKFRRKTVRPIILTGLLIATLLFKSCTTCKDIEQSDLKQKITRYNVELTKEIQSQCNPSIKILSIATDSLPQICDVGNQSYYRIVAVPDQCNGSGKENDPCSIYTIQDIYVAKITTTATNLEPPVEVKPKLMESCCRNRTGLWFFDKFEIRGLFGYRGKFPQLPYTNDPKPSTLSFDEGGSTLHIGLEVAGLWSLDKSDKFQLGFLTGLWPVDGSLFIPIGIHPRYTFKPHSTCAEQDCHTPYIYADLGIPFENHTNAPIFDEFFDRQRYYIGIGIGYDWDISSIANMDFSIDIGFRQMNLPLPEIPSSCPIATGEANPYRLSRSLYLRFGITF